MRDASPGQAGRRLRLAFLILCCANLAAFSMTASQALLPLVMAWDGVSETLTGAALSASVVPVVLVGLLCGRYIARWRGGCEIRKNNFGGVEPAAGLVCGRPSTFMTNFHGPPSWPTFMTTFHGPPS